MKQAMEIAAPARAGPGISVGVVSRDWLHASAPQRAAHMRAWANQKC